MFNLDSDSAIWTGTSGTDRSNRTRDTGSWTSYLPMLRNPSGKEFYRNFSCIALLPDSGGISNVYPNRFKDSRGAISRFLKMIPDILLFNSRRWGGSGAYGWNLRTERWPSKMVKTSSGYGSALMTTTTE